MPAALSRTSSSPGGSTSWRSAANCGSCGASRRQPRSVTSKWMFWKCSVLSFKWAVLAADVLIWRLQKYLWWFKSRCWMTARCVSFIVLNVSVYVSSLNATSEMPSFSQQSLLGSHQPTRGWGDANTTWRGSTTATLTGSAADATMPSSG